jgi:hypothetical protein
MTRHEADRVHEASGIAFTFAGHLVWGNPVLSEGLHGDVEAWRCGECRALVVGDEAATDAHAYAHVLSARVAADLEILRDRVDNISPGAFKPVEVPGAVLSDQPKAERERRNPSATAHEMGADVQRMTRVARWRDAATVQVVEYPDREHVDGLIGRVEGGAVREVPPVLDSPAQLRADGLPE